MINIETKNMLRTKLTQTSQGSRVIYSYWLNTKFFSILQKINWILIIHMSIIHQLKIEKIRILDKYLFIMEINIIQ